MSLGGTLIRRAPIVLTFTEDGDFEPASYLDQGYTHFEVVCIGAAGGPGGGIKTNNTGTTIRSYGGAGGGGGYHKVRGLLSALPETCPIVVGEGGDPGTTQTSNPALTTDGEDGGYSRFNVDTCRASGGKGGKRVQANSATVTTQAHGGEGGSGDSIVAGGGGDGATAGTPADPGPGTAGADAEDGIFVYDIGKGGGGGAGGVGKYNHSVLNPASDGGNGSYNPGDTSTYGPGGSPTTDPDATVAGIVPGGAGGAKATPITGLPTVYGSSYGALKGDDGVVIIRLTSE